MIRILINALAASAGGGLTYIRNVIPHLGTHGDVCTTLLLNASLRRELQAPANVAFIERDMPSRRLAAQDVGGGSASRSGAVAPGFCSRPAISPSGTRPCPRFC